MLIDLNIHAESVEELLETLASLATLGSVGAVSIPGTLVVLPDEETAGEVSSTITPDPTLTPVAPLATEKRDDTGMLHDARIHAKNFAKDTKGAWKPMRSIRKDHLPLYTAVYAELEVERQAYMASIQPITTPDAPLTGLPGDPVIPGQGQAQVIPITPGAATGVMTEAEKAVEVNKVITKLTELLTAKAITPDMLNMVWATHGIAGPVDLPSNIELIPAILVSLAAYTPSGV